MAFASSVPLTVIASPKFHMSGGKSFQQNNHDSSSEVPRDICPPPAPVFPTSKEIFRSESPEYSSRMAALVGYAKTISCRIRYSKASSDRAVRAPDRPGVRIALFRILSGRCGERDSLFTPPCKRHKHGETFRSLKE